MSYRKLALIMGLNYIGSNYELGGCLNDAINLKSLLPEYFSYEENNICLMTDNESGEYYPTRENILAQLESLVSRIENENTEECWISFSGHGSYQTDVNGDESDNKDECLCPLDVSTNGVISDDVIASYLGRIPSTCRVICLFDCCHSGTMGDLAYKYKYDLIKGQRRRVKRRVRRRIRRGGRYIYRWRHKWVWENKPDKWVWSGGEVNPNSSLTCPIITISGCRDPQTSADVYHSNLGKWGGALTDGFIKCIKTCKLSLNCGNLCHQLNHHMKQGSLSQQPVLCTSYELKQDQTFFRNPKHISDCIRT